jgi:type VI protein secretion system component Hcp
MKRAMFSSLLAALAAVAAWLLATPAEAVPIEAGSRAIELFLDLDDFRGESMDPAYKKQLQIDSFEFRVTKPRDPGNAELTELIFKMKVDSAFPKMFSSAADGMHIKSATLMVRKVGKGPVAFLAIKLSDVTIGSMKFSITDGYPMVIITLAASMAEVHYRPQRPDGTRDATVKSCWDFTNKKSCAAPNLLR